MTQGRLGPRAAALLAGGAYAVHQLRYLLGYGGHSHDELAGQGHAYMAALAPVLAVALVALLADLAARVADARMSDGPADSPRARGFARTWALATAGLLLAYAAQELLEGALTSGHPSGAAALLGHGGWVAIPLAAAIGLALALLARGAQGAVALAAEPAPRIALPRPASLARIAHREPLAFVRRAGRPSGARAPPFASA